MVVGGPGERGPGTIKSLFPTGGNEPTVTTIPPRPHGLECPTSNLNPRVVVSQGTTQTLLTSPLTPTTHPRTCRSHTPSWSGDNVRTESGERTLPTPTRPHLPTYLPRERSPTEARSVPIPHRCTRSLSPLPTSQDGDLRRRTTGSQDDLRPRRHTHSPVPTSTSTKRSFRRVSRGTRIPTNRSGWGVRLLRERRRGPVYSSERFRSRVIGEVGGGDWGSLTEVRDLYEVNLGTGDDK